MVRLYINLSLGEFVETTSKFIIIRSYLVSENVRLF